MTRLFLIIGLLTLSGCVVVVSPEQDRRDQMRYDYFHCVRWRGATCISYDAGLVRPPAQ